MITEKEPNPGRGKDEPTQTKNQGPRPDTAGDLGTDRDQQQDGEPAMPRRDPNDAGRASLRGSAEMPSDGSAGILNHHP